MKVRGENIPVEIAKPGRKDDDTKAVAGGPSGLPSRHPVGAPVKKYQGGAGLANVSKLKVDELCVPAKGAGSLLEKK